MTLNGRVALVTGAGRSVGLGIARALAAAGAAVAVNDLHPDRARQAAEDVAVYCMADVGDEEGFRRNRPGDC